MEKRQVYIKCFIIGTGRNGSKLLSNVLSLGYNISLYGEVEKGPYPEFYKSCYEGNLIKDEIKRYWKFTRDLRMENSKEIYLEKNHLIVPILDIVNECYPDSKFIFLKRNEKDTVASFMGKGTYSETDVGSYANGRLVPIKGIHKDFWNTYTREQKITWLVREYKTMCERFLMGIDSTKRSILLNYENLTYKNIQISLLQYIYNWIGIKRFDENKIQATLQTQFGTSAEEKATGKLPEGRKR
jgi:hypothetical protein